ncbi:protein of unknown function [Xenorhabdus poinarii G6]|uniref:Uncharacterized protein n=1 Tax=Xenorhabdus poinarii G6 TaxID=1354304 RepID=A0A068QYR0_9GAMM|nr:protein of unknown function [Xenorhabdus poinarii G6]
MILKQKNNIIYINNAVLKFNTHAGFYELIKYDKL